jgi:hypothetical protein
MASHVDIVSNEPLASEPRLLARVILNGGPGLEMDLETGKTSEQQMWSYLCSRVRIDPESDPRAFLKALALAIDATYVGASDVHDDAHCPFRRGPDMHAITEPSPFSLPG